MASQGRHMSIHMSIRTMQMSETHVYTHSTAGQYSICGAWADGGHDSGHHRSTAVRTYVLRPWRGVAWHGVAWRGVAWRGMADAEDV